MVINEYSSIETITLEVLLSNASLPALSIDDDSLTSAFLNCRLAAARCDLPHNIDSTINSLIDLFQTSCPLRLSLASTFVSYLLQQLNTTDTSLLTTQIEVVIQNSLYTLQTIQSQHTSHSNTSNWNLAVTCVVHLLYQALLFLCDTCVLNNRTFTIIEHAVSGIFQVFFTTDCTDSFHLLTQTHHFLLNLNTDFLSLAINCFKRYIDVSPQSILSEQCQILIDSMSS
ncbi:hypothetical protein P9112_000270 [Eukaryota sp. TZLM1-RC]